MLLFIMFLLRIIQRVPGNRAQVGNGRTTILTITSSSPMRRSPAAIREDACHSLLVASTASTWATIHHPWVTISSRWNTLTLTPGSPPLRRTSMRFSTLSPTFLVARRSRTMPYRHPAALGAGELELAVFILGSQHRPALLRDRSNNQLGGGAPITSGKFFFLVFYYFLQFI